MRQTFAFLPLMVFALGLAFCIPKPNNPPVTPMPDINLTFDNYDEAWKKVDSLDQKGLYKSAMEQVREIYNYAKSDDNGMQQIKAAIYIGKYHTLLDEDGFLLAIKQFESDIEDAPQPEKAVIQSMLGELYGTYLSNRYYEINQRTPIANGEGGDILTWSTEQISRKALGYYLASIEPVDALKSVRADYLDLITNPGKNDTLGTPLRPTVFDFIGNRAIQYFRNERNYLTEPVYKFYLDSEEAFGDHDQFLAYPFETRDSSSGKWLAIKAFQKLCAAHLGDERPAARIHVEHNRLNFVHSASVHPEKDDLYQNAMTRLMEQYKGQAGVAEIAHDLAYHYFGLETDEKTGDKPYRKMAVDLIRNTIKDYPGTYGAQECESLLSNILQARLTVKTEQVYLPNKPMLAQVGYYNVKNLYVRVVRSDFLPGKWDRIPYEEKLKTLLSFKPIQEKSFALPDPGDFRYHKTELGLDKLPQGSYFLIYSSGADFKRNTDYMGIGEFDVSGLAGMIMEEKGQFSLYVVDRESGAPQQDVMVEYYTTKWNRMQRKYVYKKESSGRTNSDGLATNKLPDRSGYRVLLINDTDSLWLRGRYSNYSYGKRRNRLSSQFFTDRSIYRPGQTVYFKALIYNRDPEGMPEILKNELVKVVFYDANGQERESLELRTNQFGTANGAFTAPSSGLTGNMSIQAVGYSGSKSISVEEYKRPKFEVQMELPDAAYRVSEKIKVSGNAMNFAGSVVDGAQVRYRVVRQARFPYWYGWYRRIPSWASNSMEIKFGETTTNEKGLFNIEFEAVPDRAIPKADNPVFDYSLFVDVTDISGETRSTNIVLSAGYNALQIQLGVKESEHKDSLKNISLKATNWSGKAQNAVGTVRAIKLNAPKQFFIKRLWENPDQHIFDEREFRKQFPHFAWKQEDNPENWDMQDFSIDQAFDTENSTEIHLGNGKLGAGWYKLEVRTKDRYGSDVVVNRIIRIWDDTNRNLAFTNPGFQAEKTVYQPGETASVWFGNSFGKLNIFTAQDKDHSLTNRSWKKVSSTGNLKVPVTEDDRGGIVLHGFCVFQNRILFSGNEYISVPWKNKELTIELESFRDKLAPGQQEEWRIKISGPKKDKVAAELVAGMYDASLDQFRAHSWSGVSFPSNYATVRWRDDGTFGPSQAQAYRPSEYSYTPAPNRSYRRLNWFSFPLYGRILYEYDNVAMADPVVVKDATVTSRMAGAPPAEAEYAKEQVDEIMLDDAPEGQALNGSGADSGEEAPPAPIRKNLNETVFFFPDLETDADGNVILKFTMNEALTRWKFMAFAHTPSLQSAMLTRELVTQKDLMVITNPPRFFRTGDKIRFAAKVSNLTDKPLSGTASLELLDAVTLKPLDELFGLKPETRIVQFETKAGQSDALFWEVSVPADFTGAVTWRVFADGKTVRDGEESTLPVVTNRMLVTETLPITVRGNQTREFNFDLVKSETSTPHKYSLEFTSNPAWYAVQSLPYLMEFPHECTEQIFSRLYANTLASSVTEKMPAIRRVYDKWKNTDALESNLRKNQELKYALLEETPWVMDAQSEEQQKRNIALLFDLNRMANEQEKALGQLKRRQSGNGGWSWFPGGRESWYITQHIVSGFGHLDKLGALEVQNDPNTNRMVRNALGFCEGEAQDYYRRLKQRVKKGQAKWEDDHLSSTIIQYLYARSFFEKDASDEMHKFFLEQAEKRWLGKGLYQEGMLALALKRHGRIKAATGIVNSLRERAIVKEELGMYWPFNWGFYWYQLPIETQALMVEVFDEVANDKKAVEDLRIWLLKNKQTNRWESTKATAEAVYALLLKGDNWLANTGAVKVDLGKTRLKPDEIEPGTGYFKQEWHKEEIEHSWTKIKVDNPNSNLIWGSAYYQYFEDLDKIKGFKKTPLTVEKTVYRVTNTSTGPKLSAIDEHAPIKVGDKIRVRIELRVDRAMEFVHLKDMRAAGLEPVDVLSQYHWQSGLGYYQSTRDLATHFFIDYLPRGTFVFEYDLFATHQGDMSNGITTLQCMYAPEFTSHTSGIRLKIK